jgi:serine/threonine protein kinase
LKDSFRESDDKTRIHPRQEGADRYSLNLQIATSTDDQAVELGTVLNNRFVLEEFIASGGMGAVFKAKDLLKVEAMDRNPFIAIKVLNEDFKEHPESWIALQREAQKSQRLSHPNIITVFDFTVDREKAIYFMTMELLEGESLKALIERISKDGLCLNCEKVIEVLEGIVNALSYAHKQGIIHSDLKPSNIFITHEGTVKVLDFGIARAVKKIDQIEDETIFDPAKLGALTPAYASCEMIERSPPDPRDDIYALSCIVYELLTGKHPFNRRTAMEAVANSLKPKRIERLSKGQWKGLCKGLELRRQNRTLTAAAFLMQFRRSKKAGLSVSKIMLILGLILLMPICFYGYLFYESKSLGNQIANVEFLLDAEGLSLSQVGEAKQKLKELIALNPNDTRLSALSDNVAIAYIVPDRETILSLQYKYLW